jgi:hypothetical protein
MAKVYRVLAMQVRVPKVFEGFPAIEQDETAEKL